MATTNNEEPDLVDADYVEKVFDFDWRWELKYLYDFVITDVWDVEPPEYSSELITVVAIPVYLIQCTRHILVNALLILKSLIYCIPGVLMVLISLICSVAAVLAHYSTKKEFRDE